jgi:hypothetical protein
MENNLTANGIKIVVERKDGGITTWTDDFKAPAQSIIDEVKEWKRWTGGKILSAEIRFIDHNGKFFAQQLDVKKLKI